MAERGPSRRGFLKAAGVGAAALAASRAGRGAAQLERKRPPNILFILLDDLGKEWVRCCGSEENLTPNVDALAGGGIQFTNAYCMPQCTPTRVTLMTGQYPWRHGWINHWDVPRWGAGCHFDWRHNPSIARVMKGAGYTTAAAGKWQINDFRVQPDVLTKHGFDDYCMWTGFETENPPSAERYWNPYIHTKSGSKTYEGRFGEDVYTDFLIDFMRANVDRPMMLYYAMCLPHAPLTATPLEPDAQGKEGRFRAMVRYADRMLGKLMAALDDLGIRDNTIVFWTTDNGSSPGLSARLNGREVAGGKAVTTENGVNAPFIVNCPGLVPAGVTTDALTDFTDMLPTFAGLGGAGLPEDTVIDGRSMADVILGRADDGPREWIMAMGAHPARIDEGGRVVPQHTYRDRVIRDKQYKLFVGTDRQSVKLVDLEADPGEEVDLLNSEAPAVQAARKRLEAVERSFPATDAAPKYDPTPPQSWDRRRDEDEGAAPAAGH
ncbi:MAG: sulfatase-like hydrolase/transferase [Candidatus Hydrogenedentes bacterium]|nr:sulfatase-like hydrolase/transferase [Candidatus Hydrogenedentota bacterium]